MAWRDTVLANASENPVAMSLTSTPIKGVLSATGTLDFASTLTLASPADLTVTVAGAAVGDAVFIGCPAAVQAGFIFMGFVSAANTVTIRGFNVTAGTLDPASATYRVTVVQF